MVDVLKELLWFYVVPDPRIGTMQIGQQALLGDLFNRYTDAMNRGEYRVFPMERGALIKATTDPRERLRLIADYVSGLTDASARRLHDRLTSGGDRLHDYI